MEKSPLKRPVRTYKPTDPSEKGAIFQSQGDLRNDMTREELYKWLNHQRSVIKLLDSMLSTETTRLAEVQQLFGMKGERFDPELTYQKIKSIGRLQGAAQNIQEQYQQDWTWKEKIMYIINYQKYPMKLKDLVRVYQFLDNMAGYVDDLNNTISVNLRLLKKSGRLVHYKHAGSRVGSYVHPDWIGENGKLLPEYNENTTE